MTIQERIAGIRGLLSILEGLETNPPELPEGFRVVPSTELGIRPGAKGSHGYSGEIPGRGFVVIPADVPAGRGLRYGGFGGIYWLSPELGRDYALHDARDNAWGETVEEAIRNYLLASHSWRSWATV